MKLYWITWAILLVFTVVMLWADGASMPRTAFVVFMLAAMLTKASIIGANFMHLRTERFALVFTVAVGLLVTGAILYVLIAPDAARIHGMMNVPMIRHRAVTIVAIAAVATLLSDTASAQCAMCRRALLSPEGQQMVAALRSGILFLLAAPFAVFGTVATLAIRRFRNTLGDG